MTELDRLKNVFTVKWIEYGKDTAEYWADLDALIRAVREEDAEIAERHSVQAGLRSEYARQQKQGSMVE